MEPALNAEEQARTVAEFRRVSAQPLPTNRRSLGCPLIIMTPAVLVAGPLLLPERAVLIVVFAALLLLMGGFLFFFGGAGHYGEVDRRAFTSLDRLANEFESLSLDARREAAVTALAYAFHHEGPTMLPVFSTADQSARLGMPALEYVLSIERVLIAEGLIYPTFSS